MRHIHLLGSILLCCLAAKAFGQSPEIGPRPAAFVPGAKSETTPGTPPAAGYVLGPGDQIAIRLSDADEINDKPVQIDNDGLLRLPLVGRLQAGGLTLTQFEAALTERLRTYLIHPDVSVSVTAFHSQPVSVVGAVKSPGVYQVEGRRTIFEVLSVAGGLDTTAGAILNITRRLEFGRIPLPSAVDDPTGRFSIANLKLKSILSAGNPEENIAIMPHDVITVPRAERVYVIGEVQKAGGFLLNEEESISVLQALSLAGGLDRSASPKNARILRATPGAHKRNELAVNVKAILDGKASDIQLKPDDILFIPNSQPKRAASRAAEAAIQIATGVIIWRH